jgi:cytoskeletal protein CcmA (bactofilin family)
VLTTRSLTVFEGAFIEGQVHMSKIETPVVVPLPPSREVALKIIPEKTPKVTVPAAVPEHV